MNNMSVKKNSSCDEWIDELTKCEVPTSCGSHFHLSLYIKAAFERFGRCMELRISMRN